MAKASLKLDDNGAAVVATLPPGFDQVRATALVDKLFSGLHHGLACPQRNSDDVHHFLGSMELETAVASQNKKLIVTVKFHRPYLRHSDDLLLLGAQIRPSLVMKVAKGPGEVKPPPVYAMTGPDQLHGATCLPDALLFAVQLRFVVLGKFYGCAVAAEHSARVATVCNGDTALATCFIKEGHNRSASHQIEGVPLAASLEVPGHDAEWTGKLKQAALPFGVEAIAQLPKEGIHCDHAHGE
mmetsp:Transcript_19933/g.47073  ORF Transcript_19933/g.47073 Transcript_19933/m.47073 type:complete len:241 (-) Transcript_19933:95-817(-)